MTHPKHAEVHCGNTGIDSTQSKKYIQKVDSKQKGQCTVIAITYPDTFLEQSGSHAMLTLASVRPQHKLAGKHTTPLIQNLRADLARTVRWLTKPSDGVK